jgi:hypothetical protein
MLILIHKNFFVKIISLKSIMIDLKLVIFAIKKFTSDNFWLKINTL